MKARWWLIAAVMALIFGVYQYHQNASAAATKRDQVVVADEGNQSNRAGLQADLANFVHRHMGASVSLFLAGSYDRASATAASVSPTASDGQLYAAAQAACVSHTSAVVQAQCVIAYVNARITPQAVAPSAAPASKASYTTNYKAPVWTPDAAGLALAAAAICGLVGLGLATGRRF